MQTAWGRLGAVYVCSNNKTFHVLLPTHAARDFEAEVGTAKATIVTRGMLRVDTDRGPPAVDALEFLFEDGSPDPYSIQVQTAQCTSVPSAEDVGRTDLACIVYDRALNVVAEFPASYRVGSLPCLAPWSDGATGPRSTPELSPARPNPAVLAIAKRATNWSGIDLNRPTLFYYFRKPTVVPIPIFGIAYKKCDQGQCWYETVAFSVGCIEGETAMAEPLNPLDDTVRITESAFLRAAKCKWDPKVLRQFTDLDVCP
jgi:hypothetical protein